MEFTKRQLDIINKSIFIIGEFGVNGLTTKVLAEEMNFSEPALYRHFKNKSDILNSVLIHYQSILKEGLFDMLNESNSGLEKILAVIDYQFKVFSERPEIIKLIFSESSFQNDSVLFKTITKTIEQKENRILRIITEAKKDGSIKEELNASTLTNIIMGSMRFVAFRWQMSSFKFDLIESSKQLQETISIMIKK